MPENLGVERYRVRRLVGQGGMGELFEVWDDRLERTVAVKRLFPHTLERLGGEAYVLKEARAAAKIEHPNVVRVYSVEKAGGELLIEMQFIDGRPLSALLDGTPMPGYLAADLLRQILLGLEACHARRIIHCDLKPANILVTAQSAVYITDFGIARALRTPLEQVDDADAAFGTFGTPRYSPPEAWHGEEPTFKWDLYAAGVMIFEALAGTCPIGGETMADIRAEVFRGPRITLRERRPDLSSAFLGLIESLMATHPADRPDSAREAFSQLRKTIEYKERKDSTRRILVPVPPTPLSRPDLPPLPKPRAYIAAIVVVVLLAIVAILMVLSMRYAEHPNRVATTPPEGQAGQTRLNPNSGMASGKLREPLELFHSDRSAYFAYDDGIHGSELWGIVDDEKPVLIMDINPGPAPSNPKSFLKREGGGVFFVASTEKFGQELWFSDEAEGDSFPHVPYMVFDCVPGPMGSVPLPLFSKTPYHLFVASTLTHGRELWCTSVRPGQTALVDDLNDGWGDSFDSIPCVIAYENGIFMKAIYSGDIGYALCKYQIGDDKITLVGDVNDHLSCMQVYKGKLYFMNSDDEHGKELWVHDIAAGGMKLFMDLAPGKTDSWPSSYFVWRDVLYFVAETEETGGELWRSDGTPEGTWMLADINPGTGSSNVFKYTPTGDVLFFSADTEAQGRELWYTDGTKEGTQILGDLNPGPASFTPYSTGALGDRVFFTGDDGVHGEEMWVGEKQEGKYTARMVEDLYPGPIGAGPHDLRVCNENLAIFNARYSVTDSWIHRLEVVGDTITLRRLPKPEPTPIDIEKLGAP